MNPFLREHARPLIGSALLHVGVAVGAVAAAWYTVAPKVVQPAAIEAYLAAAPRAHAGAVPETAPTPAPEPDPAPAPAPAEPPAPPAPDLAILERERKAAAAADARAAKLEEARRLEKVAQARAAADSLRRKAAERDAKRKADAEAKHRTELEAKAAAKRKAVEEAHVRDALAKEKARLEAESRKREAGEADLARQLADEQHRLGAQNAGLQARYVAALRAQIERVWNRPATAKPGIRCIVDVSQVPGGTVTDVKVGECNGDAAVVESIKGAVFKASPLPPPPDPALFKRKLHLVFNPDG